MPKSKQFLEENMTITRNNHPKVITITSTLIENKITNICGFLNSGYQVHLTPHEELKAYHIFERTLK